MGPDLRTPSATRLFRVVLSSVLSRVSGRRRCEFDRWFANASPRREVDPLDRFCVSSPRSPSDPTSLESVASPEFGRLPRNTRFSERPFRRVCPACWEVAFGSESRSAKRPRDLGLLSERNSFFPGSPSCIRGSRLPFPVRFPSCIRGSRLAFPVRFSNCIRGSRLPFLVRSR